MTRYPRHLSKHPAFPTASGWLKEIFRQLAKGGEAIILTPDANGEYWRDLDRLIITEGGPVAGDPEREYSELIEEALAIELSHIDAGDELHLYTPPPRASKEYGPQGPDGGTSSSTPPAPTSGASGEPPAPTRRIAQKTYAPHGQRGGRSSAERTADERERKAWMKEVCPLLAQMIAQVLAALDRDPAEQDRPTAPPPAPVPLVTRQFSPVEPSAQSSKLELHPQSSTAVRPVTPQPVTPVTASNVTGNVTGSVTEPVTVGHGRGVTDPVTQAVTPAVTGELPFPPASDSSLSPSRPVGWGSSPEKTPEIRSEREREESDAREPAPDSVTARPVTAAPVTGASVTVRPMADVTAAARAVVVAAAAVAAAGDEGDVEPPSLDAAAEEHARLVVAADAALERDAIDAETLARAAAEKERRTVEATPVAQLELSVLIAAIGRIFDESLGRIRWHRGSDDEREAFATICQERAIELDELKLLTACVAIAGLKVAFRWLQKGDPSGMLEANEVSVFWLLLPKNGRRFGAGNLNDGIGHAKAWDRRQKLARAEAEEKARRLPERPPPAPLASVPPVRDRADAPEPPVKPPDRPGPEKAMSYDVLKQLARIPGTQKPIG